MAHGGTVFITPVGDGEVFVMDEHRGWASVRDGQVVNFIFPEQADWISTWDRATQTYTTRL